MPLQRGCESTGCYTVPHKQPFLHATLRRHWAALQVSKASVSTLCEDGHRPSAFGRLATSIGLTRVGAIGRDPTLKTDTDVGLHSKGTAVFLKSKTYARTDHSKWNSCFTQMESLGICITGLEFSAGVLDQGVAGDSPALARALPFRPTAPDLIGSNVYSPSSPTRAPTAAHSPASSSSCNASSAHHRLQPPMPALRVDRHRRSVLEKLHRLCSCINGTAH